MVAVFVPPIVAFEPTLNPSSFFTQPIEAALIELARENISFLFTASTPPLSGIELSDGCKY